jgi:ABC-type sugar transport system permease subunit
MRHRLNLGPVLVLPSFIFIFMLLVFPIAFGFYFSLFKARFLEIRSFVGLGNFLRLLGDPAIVGSITRAFLISFFSCAVTTLVGFALAYWSHRSSGTFGYWIQIVGLTPWIISMVVGSLLWKWIFAGELGLFNYLMSILGVPPIPLLTEPLPAIGALSFVIIWRTIGYSMIMILAGLKTVPEETIEASKVDGCTPLQSILFVIIPAIRTPLLVAVIVVTLSNLNNVDVPMTLTGGGPANATNVVSLELYRMAFVYNNFSGASALAVVLFAANVILIAGYMKLLKWEI